MDHYLIAAAAIYLSVIAMKAYRERRIPNSWLFVGTIFFALVIGFWSEEIRSPIYYFDGDWTSHNRLFSLGVDMMLAQAAGAFAIALLALLSQGAIGGGDAKLAATAGVIVGFNALLTALVIGLRLAALILMATNKTIPFAPFLGAGTIAAFFI